MGNPELYSRILGLMEPWMVTHVELNEEDGSVSVFLDARQAETMPCPECGVACPRYDHRSRRWRHLDTCQFRTILVAEVPRVKCPQHGIHQVKVPWGENGSRFTALFEAVAIDWLREASIAAVSRRMQLTWAEVAGIQGRAVKRGLARRPPLKLTHAGIDETSYQKRHKYVTVVNDIKSSDVVFVADGRGKESASAFFESLTPEQLEALQVVAMDMSGPFISAAKDHLTDADKKIAFDRFHVAKALGEAVDKVRREEHRALQKDGDMTLVGSKYLWLKTEEDLDPEVAAPTFEILKAMALKTARAWAIKEHARFLWSYVSRAWAMKAWNKWIGWAMRSKLEPMKKAAKMVKDHLYGIINAIVLNVSNAGAESLNAKIQRVKRMACGYRNRERFRNAIYFHLGGLDLYPDGYQAFPHTHTGV
jgi:transposase